MSKVIDVNGGVLAVLGKALVLPTSDSDGSEVPLNGSLRYNPTYEEIESFVGGSWSSIGSGSGGGNNHTHDMSQITGLVAALAAKSPVIHAHAISEITNLQTVLDGKAELSHSHTIAHIPSLQSSLDTLTSGISTLTTSKANTAHTHTIANVTGLQDALDGKAATNHVHSYGEIPDLNLHITMLRRHVYDIFFPGAFPAEGTELRYVITNTMYVDQNFFGSRLHHDGPVESDAGLQVLLNDVLVGTITITTMGHTFLTTLPVGFVANVGDVMKIRVTDDDAQLQNLTIALVMHKNAGDV